MRLLHCALAALLVVAGCVENPVTAEASSSSRRSRRSENRRQPLQDLAAKLEPLYLEAKKARHP